MCYNQSTCYTKFDRVYATRLHWFASYVIQDNQILTASWLKEDALQLWDFGQGQLVKNIPFQVKQGEPGAYLYCGQFCSNSVVVAGGSGTKSVQAINIHSGKVMLSFIACLDGAEVTMSRPKIGRSPVQVLPKTNFSIVIKLPVKSTWE